MTIQKYMLIADTILHCKTPERMVKIIRRMKELVESGEMSWNEYRDLTTYRRFPEADHQFALKVIELLNT